MHSRILVFFWRRKLILFGSSVLFLAIWFLGFLYSSHVGDDGRAMSIKDIMLGNKKDEGLLQKLGFHEYNHNPNGKEKEKIRKSNINTNSNDDLVRFLKPTSSIPNLYAIGKKEKYFNDWNKIMQDKDEKDRMENFAILSRDELTRRKANDEMKLSADKQAQYEHHLKKMGVPVIVGLGPTNRHPAPLQRLVHFDLKGAPLKISYFLKILPILKSLGATGILIEYEDMFPFSGILSSLSAKNAYSRKNIIEILQTAESLNLAVIPLVQTFGHLEFALKLKEFYHLREIEDTPQSLCPSLNSSFSFIIEMINQVVELHTLNQKHQQELFSSNDNRNTHRAIPKLTHIHIGCDEVFQLGECPRCRARVRDQLFLDHVYSVSAQIKKQWPHLKIIVWDDMLRHISLEFLQNSGLGKIDVQPMVWAYSEDIYKFIQSQTWDKYSQVFKTVWTAGAFKGAFGETMMVPVGRRHLENTLRWLAIIQGEGSRFSEGIQGIALTGWQRYDHFATLCELFPVALPSLAICLNTATKGYFDIDSKHSAIVSALTCPEAPSDRYLWLDLQKDPSLGAFSRCMFPGSSIFRFINRLSALIVEAREFIDSIKLSRGWLSDYNIRHNFSSPTRILELLDDQPRLLASLTNLAKNTIDSMWEVYDHWTIGEYVEQRIYPIINELRNLEKVGDNLKMKKTWPQRPLPYLKQLEMLGVSPKSPK